MDPLPPWDSTLSVADLTGVSEEIPDLPAAPETQRQDLGQATEVIQLEEDSVVVEEGQDSATPSWVVGDMPDMGEQQGAGEKEDLGNSQYDGME